jgi:luciferase family oxidoreductase group 1
MVPLSVLDLSPVTSGASAAVALHNSLDLARFADRRGYTRYWLAEHHNLASIASTAPEIMIGEIAARTQHLRVGSGGVMLPNHAPLMVAERFKVLEALHPGRIDLGIGRAPGTDPLTSIALRRRQEIHGDHDFLERLQELLLLEREAEHHPLGQIRAMPTGVRLPPIWLLGSSNYSAELSAAIGVGFSFAHHFATHDAVAAMRFYRDRFRPSVWREKPYAILAVAVVCAPDDAEAEELASTADLGFVRRAKGEYPPLASPQEAAAYPYTAAERALIRQNRSRLAVGSPTTVRERLGPLIEATGADELMVTSMIHDHGLRKRSYELLAGAFGVQPPGGA